jgi:hypothetical protein
LDKEEKMNRKTITVLGQYGRSLYDPYDVGDEGAVGPPVGSGLGANVTPQRPTKFMETVHWPNVVMVGVLGAGVGWGTKYLLDVIFWRKKK